jgi:hypothetical protein
MKKTINQKVNFVNKVKRYRSAVFLCIDKLSIIHQNNVPQMNWRKEPAKWHLKDDVKVFLTETESYSIYSFYKQYNTIPKSMQKKEFLFRGLPMGNANYDGLTSNELELKIAETGKPAICFEATEYKFLEGFLETYILFTLIKRHWKELPEGNILLWKIDYEYYEYCKQLQIRRRRFYNEKQYEIIYNQFKNN